MVRGIIAPTYFWPGATGVPDGWSRVILAATYVSTVLLNPDSGPGQQQIQEFVDITRQSQAAGLKVLGYVDSSYGSRAISDVLSDIDTYSSWYQVDGFFIDDMYILVKNSSLYANESVARTQLIFNPGAPDVPEAYLPLADTFVSFEGSATSYQSFQPAAYTNNYTASKFWHIVYDCNSNATINATLQQFTNQTAEFLYLTDLGLPNPYNNLPSIDTWAQLLSYMANV
ncbi:TPA: hypothetical protein ACH3X2_002393 [Trebouxia sp. C0005]